MDLTWWDPEEKKWLPYLALIGAVISLGVSVYLFGWGDIPEGNVLGGMISIDPFSLFFQVFASLVAGLIILLSIAYMDLKSPYQGEFYSFILLASFSISLLASSADLVMIFIAFELLSISSYILTGFLRHDPKGSEAAIKYFLYGSLASAMLLYGMSLLYGTTGSTNLVAIAEGLMGSTPACVLLSTRRSFFWLLVLDIRLPLPLFINGRRTPMKVHLQQ